MKQKERGDGTISQRKDGTWTGRIFLGRDSTGKQKVKAVYGKTEKEVKAKLKQVKEEMIKFETTNLPKLTVSELLISWQTTVKKYELKPSSYDRLEKTINNNIIPYIGYLQITSITPQDIQQYINQLTDKGYSYSSIKKAYNAINASLKMAFERDYIRKNPCINIKLPKQIKHSKSDIEFFTDEEAEIIVNAATHRYRTGRYMYKHGYAVVLLLNTGMRIGELLALKWQNVDFDNGQIYICETRGQIIERSDNKQRYIMADRSTKNTIKLSIRAYKSKNIASVRIF